MTETIQDIIDEKAKDGLYSRSGLRSIFDRVIAAQTTISPADWTWQRATMDGQACWVWFIYDDDEAAPEWELFEYHHTLTRPIIFLANHPQGLPPPDGFRLKDGE